MSLISLPGLNAEDPAREKGVPTLFIIGDSTAAKGNGHDQEGWGTPFSSYFDSNKVMVRNLAKGGRSSRTFITEGHWGNALSEFNRGDLVLIQFGHNDIGAINEEPPGSTKPLRARGTLKGIGPESIDIINALTGNPETVYTFGHYMRRMVSETKAKGAVPILLSPTARNIWEGDSLERGIDDYGAMTYQIALESGVQFVDLTGLMVKQLQGMGQEGMAAYYPNDHTHTNPDGADLHARAVISGIKGLRPNPVEGLLSEKGKAVEADQWTWLNLPLKAKKGIPTLFLVGDSTVRNGRGDGFNGEWGWGDYLYQHLDTDKLNIVNRAVGGMSSRTFYTSEFWETVRDWMLPGDFVIIQFGHNDNHVLNDSQRARGTIKGVGDESREIDNMLTGRREVVHTYGWYLRQYVREIRERGATPIICSPVPRKVWSDEKTIQRDNDGYAGWAKQVAVEEKVPFVDLHNTIADQYDTLGMEIVENLFADEHTHTSQPGAVLNAACVADGLRALENSHIRDFLLAGPKEVKASFFE